MPETAQTFRRGIAILLIPLSIIVIEIGMHLRYQHGLVNSWVLDTARTCSWILLIAALGYLVVSGLISLYSIAQKSS